MCDGCHAHVTADDAAPAPCPDDTAAPYPERVCQNCGDKCDTTQEVYTGAAPAGWELWCYCEACDIETFHPLPIPTGARAFR